MKAYTGSSEPSEIHKVIQVDSDTRNKPQVHVQIIELRPEWKSMYGKTFLDPKMYYRPERNYSISQDSKRPYEVGQIIQGTWPFKEDKPKYRVDRKIRLKR